MLKTIVQERIEAAKATRGTSDDAIYDLVINKALDYHVAGTTLDFGAGTGNFARLLCSNTNISSVVAADIVEYGDNFHHPKLEWMFHDLNFNIPMEAGVVDAVFAIEVIEHLENPRHLAREWFRVLKPGGALFVSTPNNETWRSILSLVFKNHHAAFTGDSYPKHITAILPLDLTRVFSEAGFKEADFFFTDHGKIPKLASLTWQKVSGGLLKGLRYSDNLLCIAVKPMIQPKMFETKAAT